VNFGRRSDDITVKDVIDYDVIFGSGFITDHFVIPCSDIISTTEIIMKSHDISESDVITAYDVTKGSNHIFGHEAVVKSDVLTSSE
jgi:hypothetical protein